MVSSKEITVAAKEPIVYTEEATVFAKVGTVTAKEHTVSTKGAETTESAKEPVVFAKVSTKGATKETKSTKDSKVSAKEAKAAKTKESKSSKIKPQPPLSRTGSTSHLLPEHHPAHALLSVAHALLAPASTIAKTFRGTSKPDLISTIDDKQPTTAPTKPDEPMLPIDEITMPESEVSDLRDIVDAINKLCDTMKTSTYDREGTETDTEIDNLALIESYSSGATSVVSTYADCINEMIINPNYESNISLDQNEETVVYRDIELVSPEENNQRVETNERWSDSTSISLPGQIEDLETVTSDTDPNQAQCEPVSEMYFTASSEVSLISDENERAQNDEERDDRKRVIAGHVAAMRERFESMTRTSTPCPDLIRSLSPSLEVFRNASPSPDRMT